jgi:hypothetical protein
MFDLEFDGPMTLSLDVRDDSESETHDFIGICIKNPDVASVTQKCSYLSPRVTNITVEFRKGAPYPYEVMKAYDRLIAAWVRTGSLKQLYRPTIWDRVSGDDPV